MAPKKRKNKDDGGKARSGLFHTVFESLFDASPVVPALVPSVSDTVVINKAIARLSTTVKLSQLKSHNPNWKWEEERDWAYGTIVGSVIRRLYMDSQLKYKTMQAIRKAWDGNQALLGSGQAVKAMLPCGKDHGVSKETFIGFLLTLDGRALYQRAVAGDIAPTDVIAIAWEWAGTLATRYSEEEAGSEGELTEIRSSEAKDSKKAGTGESGDDGEGGKINENEGGGENEGAGHNFMETKGPPDTEQESPPPKGAVKSVTVDPSVRDALSAWKALYDARGVPAKASDLPPLIPLPRHFGGREFGVNRKPGIIDPDQGMAKKDASGKDIAYTVEFSVSEEALEEMAAALAQDDDYVDAAIHRGDASLWSYHVEGKYLIDELSSECGHDGGKEISRTATLICDPLRYDPKSKWASFSASRT